jgi:hypothetical protein
MAVLPISVAGDGGAARSPGKAQRERAGETSMAELRFILGASYIPTDPVTLAEKEVLQRAVAKVVLLGEQVGVSTDQMILLLNSGLTVSELLEYLAMRAGYFA